jgi:hypothetical protein
MFTNYIIALDFFLLDSKIVHVGNNKSDSCEKRLKLL